MRNVIDDHQETVIQVIINRNGEYPVYEAPVSRN